jgi:hypothetical protein
VLSSRLAPQPPAPRSSDADRERAIETLKLHFAEGRLSAQELESRVDAVYRSATRPEIGIHLRDLPLRDLRRSVVGRIRRFQRAVLRLHAAAYASANGALIGIWALTGHGVFWPAWLLIPSTAVLGWHLFASRALTRTFNRRGW